MATINLANTANNIAGMTLSSAYTDTVSTSFVVTSVLGTLPPAPFRITVVTAASYQTSAEVLAIFMVTSVSGTTFNLGGTSLAIEGTANRSFASGDRVDLRCTAGTVSDLNTAVTPEVTPSISAAGSIQSTATPLAIPNFFGTTSYYVVTSVAANTGVSLWALTTANIGSSATITNNGANPLLVYPATGDTINGQTANLPVTIPAGGTQTFYGSSSAAWLSEGSDFPNIQVFTATGTWVMPPLANVVRVIMIGGGSGGGGGIMESTATTAAWGGGGGGGGAYTEATFRAIDLTATVSVTVGTGGAGGAGGTVSGTTATNGSGGNNTSFGAYARALGAVAFTTGGSLSSGTGGPGANGMFSGIAGASSSATAAPAAATTSLFGPSGGGAGGGQSTGSTTFAGSAGGTCFAYETVQTGAAGGAHNASGVGVAGTAGSSTCSLTNVAAPGAGGGGGGAGSTTGGAGGNGGLYGAGGGGGGMGQSTAGGAGGNGANGICIVITT